MMSLNQSHPALTIRGHRLPEEEPVQADGGTGRSSRHRHCGREHPHPSGQGEKYGECTHSMSAKSCCIVVRIVCTGPFQPGSFGADPATSGHSNSDEKKSYFANHCDTDQAFRSEQTCQKSAGFKCQNVLLSL